MKPTDVKSNTYFDFKVENNDTDRKFEVGDCVRISKYKVIFAKGYTRSCPENFVIKEIKNTVLWTYVISDLNDENFVGILYEKKLQKNKSNRV